MKIKVFVVFYNKTMENKTVIQFFLYKGVLMNFNNCYLDLNFNNYEEMKIFLFKLKKTNNIYEKIKKNNNHEEIFLILNNPHFLSEELQKICNKSCIGYSLMDNMKLLYEYKDLFGNNTEDIIDFLEKNISQKKLKKMFNINSKAYKLVL
jgi:hypothetical protein